MQEILKDKRIMVTGGTGTVGQALVKSLLQYEPKVVRVFSRDEHKQFEMQQELAGKFEESRLRFLLGDVRDKERLRRAMEDIDVVFHLAALKHVPACEYNPSEAVKTNVIGTQNVIECAIENEVSSLIYASSDKAASPTNTMGASKLLAERLISSADQWKGPRGIKFLSVRFGNVLNSRGSVVPLFAKQIKGAGPITVTEPTMTRFVMDVNRSVDLIFQSLQIARGGETIVFKMPVLRIGDLAQAIVDISGRSIAIKSIGLRPGEKMYEELMSEEESVRALETEDLFIILPYHQQAQKEIKQYSGAQLACHGAYSSDDAPLMNIAKIKAILEPSLAELGL